MMIAKRAAALLCTITIVLLAGCASGPRGAPTARVGVDGPEANPPADLARVPDAEPRAEAIRIGGPNKPYEALGQSYVPITQDKPFSERGLASWYGRAFHGRKTASGEVYNMYAMTAAHPTLPIPSYARIRNPANGREVIVRINDRGPFVAKRIVDLSYTAALRLDLLRNVAPVELTRITSEDIRTGAWRRDAGETTTLAAGAAAPTSVVVPSASVVPVGSAAPSPMPEEAARPETAPVPPPINLPSVEPTSVPPTTNNTEAQTARAYTTPARGYWVQLGAFRERGGAESFQGRVAAELDWISPLLTVFSDASLYRLQAGPYPSREEARGVAERLRVSLQLVPLIVERR